MAARLVMVLAIGVLGSLSFKPAAAQELVGSFRVADGPSWEVNPPVYSCLDACALLFGGSPSAYSCSVSDAEITNTAWLDGYADDGLYCGNTPGPEDFVFGTTYDCGDQGCAYSAYVNDHNCQLTNYCFGGDETPPDGVCGDGTVDDGEACDDGNTEDGDCCSSSCQYEPAGTECSDGDACNGAETCSEAGECQAATSPLACDDGDPCTRDSCDAELGCTVETGPLAECTEASSASLYVERKLVDFHWSGTAEKSEFGNPLKDDDTALCVYDGAGAPLGALSVSGGQKCGKRSCWKAHSTGFTFGDLFGKSDGVRQIKLKAGSGARSGSHSHSGKIALDAWGKNMSPITVPSTSSTIVAQVVNDSGSCFQATFEPHEQKKWKKGKLKAKHRNQ